MIGWRGKGVEVEGLGGRKVDVELRSRLGRMDRIGREG